MTDYKQAAHKILGEISHILEQQMADDNNAGLLGGYTGCALFYAYYYQLTGDETHQDKMYQVIQKSLEAMAEQELHPSHCNGIAGIAWCLQHLIKMGHIEEDGLEDAFEEIDILAGTFMEADLQDEKYDFLHQGLGAALYFLEQLPNENAAAQLNKLVDKLAASATTTPHGITWRDHFSKTSQEDPTRPCYNLGLAHGVPAIIAILAMIHEKGIAPEKTAYLVEQSVKWLLAVRNKGEDSAIAQFPVMVDINSVAINGAHSRLGWCYGDLGIATTLWQTGARLQQPAWQEEALQIYRHIIAHRDPKNGSVYDACLCHGSAGIAHILQQAHKTSGDPLIGQAAGYWLQHTLEINTWEDGFAGYKFYTHPAYENSYNLLEGIAGVGLALIAFLDEQTVPAWNRCLLLS